MEYYPVFLDLRGRRVLLVGGGRVASEKVDRLVRAGAHVTVVAPQVSGAVRDRVEAGEVAWRARPFAAGDTEGAFVVVVATGDGSLNRTVADEARVNGALVNAADDAANCDYILPAVVERGRLTLAASTGGSSPAMARWLRGRMEGWLAPEVAALADLAADLRLAARSREATCASRCPRAGTPPPLCCSDCPNRIPAAAWQEAMGDDLVALLRDGRRDRAEERLSAALGLDRPPVEVPWRQEGAP